MKKEFLSVFTFIISIGFVSSEGLSDLLNGIDESTILLFAVFIVSFTLLFFSLNRVFKKENTTTSGIISVVISFLIVYALSKSEFNLSDSLSSIGISSEALGIIIPLIIVAGIVVLVMRFKRDSLYFLGVVLIVLSFFVYAKTLLITVGIILIAVRIALGLRKKGGGLGLNITPGGHRTQGQGFDS